MTIDEEINFMNNYNISPNELFAIRAILISKEDGDLTYLSKYLSIPESIRGSLHDSLVSLQNRGIILKSYKIPNLGEKFIVEDVEFNKNFVKSLYKASFEMGKELFDNYPQFTTINGNTVMLRSVSKKYNSLEDAYRAYGKAIKWKPEIHNEIIELLNWAKEHDIINCSLANFIVDNKWIDLKALKEGEGSNINFDAIKIV